MKKHNLLFLLIALLVVVLYDCDNTSERLEANKNLILRFTEATNAADWNAFDELLTQDFKRHCQATPNVQVNSREGFKRLQESFLESIPDIVPGLSQRPHFFSDCDFVVKPRLIRKISESTV